MNTKKKKIDEKMKPSAVLAKSFSDNFTELVVELIFLIREYGINKSSPPPFNNKEEWLEFTTHVHEGWKKAQTIISEKVSENLKAKDCIKQKTKEFRRKKNAEKIKILKKEEYHLQVEITVLRRLLDAIAWTVLKHEHSTIRRLPVKGGEHNLSIKNIKDAMPTVETYNKYPHKMALCSDLTSFIHIGDILLSDVSTEEIQLIELKEGEKNLKFTKFASFAVNSKCERYEAYVTSGMSTTEKKHFERVKKQYKRASDVTNTINNEGGIDHNTDGKVKITPISPSLTITSYAKKIVECYRQLDDKKTWAIDVIDNCLHIGVYNNSDHAFVGFNVWMDGIKCTSPIYNITDSFRIPLAPPFACLNLPTEILNKIVRGEITIILCLNLRAFIEETNKKFLNYLSLASKKKSVRANQSHYLLPTLDGQALKFNNSNGNAGLLGQGMIDRIIFDLQHPLNFIEIHKSTLDG